MERELLRIQGLEDYIQANGIEAQRQDDEEVVPNIESTERVEQESEYQRQIHEQFFGTAEEGGVRKLEEERIQFLDKYAKDVDISIVTAQGVIQGVPLYDLATASDTVYTLVSSKEWSHLRKLENGDEEKSTKMTKSFSLQQFDEDAVRAYLSVVSGKIHVNEITPTNLYIDCCHISHFLQSKDILNDIVNILKESIDSDNCGAMCILADQLQLSELLEVSLSHVLHQLDEMQDHDEWHEFPKSLQHQVLTLRNAMKSSLLAPMGGDGSSKRVRMKKVFFHSSTEFLSIFSDTIRDHKERLADAKLRQEEIIRERQDLNRRRRHDMIDPMSGSVLDAEMKIQRQEARIQTLESFYREQKNIFASNDDSFAGSFKL